MITKIYVNDIAYKIVGCAIEVHKQLGPGLLESVYQTCLIDELKAVEFMIPLYRAQLLSYLKLTRRPKGLLINFHGENIIEQMVPLVTEEFAKLPNS